MEKQFKEIYEEIKKIDIYLEIIHLTYNLKQFAELFKKTVSDEKRLSDIFDYLNDCALEDGKFGVNMAAVFASRQLDDVTVKGSKVRNSMLSILQKNFQNIASMKKENMSKFYNSVTLLGEYYNRKKLPNGQRIHILGQSLLILLTSELEEEMKKTTDIEGYGISAEFAKLILSQITLNGVDAKTDHKKEITDLMFTIRKCLINVQNLEETVKAFLLMTLDLYYSNFNIVGDLLNNLYGKYLIDDDKNNDDKKCDKNSDKSSPKSANSNSEDNKKEDVPPKKENQDETKETDLIYKAESSSDLKDKNVITTTKSNMKNDNCKNSDSNSGSPGKTSNPKLITNGDNVLKQNGNSQKLSLQKLKIETGSTDKAYFKEENVENLTWEALASEDEASPQKNPYSKSFMKFLSNK